MPRAGYLDLHIEGAREVLLLGLRGAIERLELLQPTHLEIDSHTWYPRRALSHLRRRAGTGHLLEMFRDLLRPFLINANAEGHAAVDDSNVLDAFVVRGELRPHGPRYLHGGHSTLADLRATTQN